MLFIAIQANLGAGKSSVLDCLKAQGYTVMQEPIEIWDSYMNSGCTLLEHFYGNPQRWSFTLQVMILLNFVKFIEILQASHPNSTIILERSPEAGYRIFVRRLLESGVITPVEVQLYQELYQKIVPHYNIINIYLRVDPLVALRRVQLRGRAAERTVTLEYLDAISHLHDDWLLPQTITIDANQPLDIVCHNIRQYLNNLGV
jgi:thymidine kinase